MVGNNPNFSKLDVIRCFLFIQKKISRSNLVKELSLGEGTVRTILNILKKNKLIDSTKEGHSCTKKGKEVLKKINESIGELKKISLRIYPKTKKASLLIRDNKKKIENYILRDIAVKNGADGALILEYKNRLSLPEFKSIEDFKEIENIYSLKNNDIVVVSFASDYRIAQNGCLAIALELDNSLGKFFYTHRQKFLYK